MSIMVECPKCRTRQSLKNKKCSCGENLIQAKKSERVRYWVGYRLANGKQKHESCGTKLEDARAADGKRRIQKKENRLFDIKPDDKITFSELSKWFLGLEKNKAKAYYQTLIYNLKSFNDVFGETVISQIKPADLEDYQAKQKAAGLSDSYIDQQIGAARSVINRAFDNDKISGDTLRVFKKVKKLLKKNSNARDVILTMDQFKIVMENLPAHTRGIFSTGFYTGMRKNEILSLTWDKVDLKKRIIHLSAADTKDREKRDIPISSELYHILKEIPKALHDKHVFLYRGKSIKDLRTALSKACEAAGINYGRDAKNGFVFHDLRHCFNTYMRKAGVAESIIMKITGHSTREMFDRYDKIDAADKLEAVTKLESFLTNQSATSIP